MPIKPYKFVKLRTERWAKYRALADELEKERGGKVSIPDVLDEAIQVLLKARETKGLL